MPLAEELNELRLEPCGSPHSETVHGAKKLGASWEHKLFFPTRVMTAHSDDPSMLDGLRQLFRSEDRYRDAKFAEIADEENMMDYAARYPAIAMLKKFMWDGMVSWLRAEDITGEFVVQVQVFSNYSKKGAYVPAHNHEAHVSGVYYVDIPGKCTNDIFVQGDSRRYWAQDPGVLILHDPRFNSSLVELANNTYVKMFPRSGMGIIFPSYLWHSVTPHFEDQDRISIAFNFIIHPKARFAMPTEKLVL